MSVHISSTCWTLDLRPTEKLVLLSFADQANDAGECWPSIGSIMWRTGLSDRGVQRAISRLVTLGYLARKDERKGHSTIWLLPVEVLEMNKRARLTHNPRPRVAPTKVVPPTHGRPPPTKGRPTPDPRSPPPPTHGHPESLVESVIESSKKPRARETVIKNLEPEKPKPTREEFIAKAVQLGLSKSDAAKAYDRKGSKR